MHHSSASKANEKRFGVLFRKFRILYNRCILQCIKEMSTVVKVWCIINSMIEDARDYEGTMQFRRELDENDDLELNLKDIMSTECRVEQERQWREEF